MAFRVLLVVLVGSLGLELPNGAEFSRWQGTTYRWLSPGLRELSKWGGLAGRDIYGIEEDSKLEGVRSTGPSGRDDLAFEAVVEGMASTFAIDLASSRDHPSAGSVAPVVDASPEPTADEVPNDAGTLESPTSRLEKIGTAVKLTRQAVDAWASLIRLVDIPGFEDSL